MSDMVFECRECGMHYKDEEWMKKCQEFCAANQACSIEIVRFSIESTEPADES